MSWRIFICVGVALMSGFCTHCNAQSSQPSDPFYIGGVFEFPALHRDHRPEDVSVRISQFRQLMEEAVVKPDIIVFPESVLNNLSYPIVVPDPGDNIVPCADSTYDYIITEISCYARSLQIYLLINVIEMHNVSSSGETIYYNTNVVYDRRGVVISRYRKYNLIGAEWQYLNYTQQPELEATFETDFNVTFGHFTRMDLLYYRPAQALVARGIRDFLHPSKWQSELPFMTAMQLHQSWAWTNDVNLLVAGTNDPLNGRTGSGIYAGKYGALIASMTTDETRRKLHLNVLPKSGYDLGSFYAQQTAQAQQKPQTAETTSISTPTQFPDRITGVVLGRESDIDLYSTLPINDTDGDEIRQRLCHDKLCCDFHLRRSVIQSPIADSNTTQTQAARYFYRLAVFQGTGTFLNTEPDVVAVCAIFACVADHIYSCGRIYDETTLVENRFAFDYIKISGNFTQRSAYLVLPNSVDGMLMPLPAEAFDMDVRTVGNVSMVNYTLLQPKADLLTFGIYVNYYIDESIYDHHKGDGNTANCGFAYSLLLLWLCAALCLI